MRTLLTSVFALGSVATALAQDDGAFLGRAYAFATAKQCHALGYSYTNADVDHLRTTASAAAEKLPEDMRQQNWDMVQQLLLQEHRFHPAGCEELRRINLMQGFLPSEAAPYPF